MIEVRYGEKTDRWVVEFDYSPSHVTSIKQVGGAKFVPHDKGGPYWTIPATLDSWDTLHEYFTKQELSVDINVKLFVRDWKREAKILQEMASADHAELEMLPELNPALHEWVSSRGYQLADIAFMARCPHPLNTNDPGTGKTAESIATVYESGLDEGPVLVVAPATSLDTAWAPEVRRWVADDVPVVTPGPPGAARRRTLETVLADAKAGRPCWVIVNPESIKQKNDGTSPYPEFYEVEWNVVILDEFHRMGLGNNTTLAFKSLRKLKADKRIALSGTPMGGQPIKLWGVLHFLYPDVFSSKWAFAGNWLTVFDNGFGKTIGDVKKHRRDAFTQMLNQYSVRRLKKDVMKWLPEVQHIERWVELTGEQKKQYDEWEANGEIEIEEEMLDAVSVLALYTRLRQFAMARQTVEVLPDESIKLTPTDDSAKLPALLDILADRGIGQSDVVVTDPVIVFSQFTQVIDMVEAWLSKNGIETRKITGAVKGADRTQAVKDFQDGTVDVMLMNTNAGGVAITLDRSDTVVFLDETWNPDDQEQAWSRAHRGQKTSQVMVYRILAKDTIDERIFRGNISKDSINQRVLNNRHKDLT